MTDTYTPVLTDAEIECLLSFGCHPMTSVHAIARAIERAAIKAYQSQQGATEAHFDLWQDDMVVASAFGPRDRALAEIQHYAAVYGQDGPVQIEEVIRMPISALTPPPEAP